MRLLCNATVIPPSLPPANLACVRTQTRSSVWKDRKGIVARQPSDNEQHYACAFAVVCSKCLLKPTTPALRPATLTSINRWERSHSTSPRCSEVVCVRELDGNTSPEAVQSRPPLTPPTLFDFSSVRLRTRRLRCPVDAAKNAISSRGLVERWPAPIHKQFVQRRLLPYHRPSHPLMLVGKDPPTGYAVVTAMCPSRRVLQHRRHPSTVQAGPRATAARCAQTLADGVA